MFHERDVLVYQEMARDRRPRREEDRLLAAGRREEPVEQAPVPRRPMVKGFRLVVQKLLPAR